MLAFPSVTYEDHSLGIVPPSLLFHKESNPTLVYVDWIRQSLGSSGK